MLSDSTPIFFGKTSCINNRKQKEILRQAGVAFVEHDLLAFPWSADLLAQFFRGVPKNLWVNPSAPDIKQGTVQVDKLSEAELLNLMVANPLLIRRPLISWQGQHWVGFDWAVLSEVLPTSTPAAETLVRSGEDLESCPRSHA